MNTQQDRPSKLFSFSKNNKPDVNYFVYEIWEDKMPDQVIAKEKIGSVDERTLSSDQLIRLIPFWRKLAKDKRLKKPILSIQIDSGDGSELAYGYTDGRDGVPPNAKFYIIKPIFDKNIALVRLGNSKGKSIVYHSPLNSPDLQDDLEIFNKLLSQFIHGDFHKLFSKYVEKSIGWEFCNEIIFDKLLLRK